MYLSRKLLLYSFLFFVSATFSQARMKEEIVIVDDFDNQNKAYNSVRFIDSNVKYINNSSLYNLINFKRADLKYWNTKRVDSLFTVYNIFPDIVVSDKTKFAEKYVDSLNKIEFYKVNAKINDTPLKGVNWKELPNVITTGEFISTSTLLSPKKRGFWFSPDIFNFSANNLNGPKVFNAYKYDLKEKLRISVSYNKNAKNVMPYNDVLTNKDVIFDEDKERGKTAGFNGETSYIDINTAAEINFKELSITAWIKPKSVQGTLSIVGKGESFSAKIENGYLQFTSPDIKDHNTKEILVKPNEWVHISFVYIPSDKVFFYINGNLVEEQEASEIDQTDHSILIGTNLWGENYQGLMSELNIWTRALSDGEIYEVYSKGVITEKKPNYSLIIGVSSLVLLVIGFALLRIRKNKKRFFKAKNPLLKNSVGPVVSYAQYNVQCLGGFKILSKNFEDISHKFSPKRRELLILILLFTIREGGITSKKMGQILWPNFSSSNVKNNRSTQIREIRNILEDCLDLNIVYVDKKWKILLGDTILIDIVELQKLTPNVFKYKKGIAESLLPNVIKIINLGSLLPNIELNWVDEFKGQYGNVVLDSLIPFLQNKEDLSNSIVLELSKAILIIDPLYEDALRVKVEVLTAQGKHMSVKKEIENFKQMYEQFYKEPYKKKFI